MDNKLVVSQGIGDDFDIVGALKNHNTSYSSIDSSLFSDTEKAKFFEAINSPEFKIGDFINKEIKMQNVYCEVIEAPDMATGELVKLVRTVIIDDKGNGYSCASKGVFSSLAKIFSPSFYGNPPFEKPLIVMPVFYKTKKGFNTLSLKPIGFAK